MTLIKVICCENSLNVKHIKLYYNQLDLVDYQKNEK